MRSVAPLVPAAVPKAPKCRLESFESHPCCDCAAALCSSVACRGVVLNRWPTQMPTTQIRITRVDTRLVLASLAFSPAYNPYPSQTILHSLAIPDRRGASLRPSPTNCASDWLHSRVTTPCPTDLLCTPTVHRLQANLRRASMTGNTRRKARNERLTATETILRITRRSALRRRTAIMRAIRGNTRKSINRRRGGQILVTVPQQKRRHEALSALVDYTVTIFGLQDACSSTPSHRPTELERTPGPISGYHTDT